MEECHRVKRRAHLAKMIEEKRDRITKLKRDLQQKKKTLGDSVDDQLVIAELEYQVGKEEVALLTLQEQHWESAAHWEMPQTPDIQKQVCEILHSYISSVKEKGSIPALHASEHLALENSILISSQGVKPSIPTVEWAHHSTDLQIGDRLLEINGILVVGKEPSEVNRILESCRPLCRIVFLRPVSVYQLLKSNGCRETSNLRHELTSVVSRLNHKMMENSKLKEQTIKLQNDCEDLKMQNRKLKLQVLSLQSVLLYLFQVVGKDSTKEQDSLHDLLTSECPAVFDVLKQFSEQNGTLLGSESIKELLNGKRKSIPSLELCPNDETEETSVESQSKDNT